jgi:hypothetical protein
MPSFAKCVNTVVGSKYLVADVIKADQEFINTQTGFWVLGDYNTYGNVHYAPSPPAEPMTPDGGTPIRANYPGVGYTYDTSYSIGDFEGVFYAPQPFPSWTLNTTTFLWEAPVEIPTSGGPYKWNESTQSWVTV